MRYRYIRDESELEITHTRGSGPGGQNRNKRNTAVRVRHIPTGLVVLATERRSQGQNLAAALERLDDKLAQYYHRPADRHATKPTKSSKTKRLQSKAGRAKTKVQRRKPSDSDW